MEIDESLYLWLNIISYRQSQTLLKEGTESGGSYKDKMAELPKDDSQACSAIVVSEEERLYQEGLSR